MSIKHLLLIIVTHVSLSGLAQFDNHSYVPGELLVLLNSDRDAAHWCEHISANSGVEFELKERLSPSMNLYRIGFDSGEMDDETVLKMVQRNAEIQIAQFNHTGLEIRTTPNDPLFDEQWAFFNDGTNGGPGDADIDALDAWDIATGGLTADGDTIVVAVIDNGFDIEHIDLKPNFFVNRHEIDGNGIDDDGNGYVDDRHGWNLYTNGPVHFSYQHGTHVSGTIGAVGNNQTGVTGVNWNVKVMPISGSSSLESTVVGAYAYALEMRKMYNQTGGQKGAYIVATNSSFGNNYADPEDYPLWCAMYDSLGYAGILSAGATMNVNADVDQVGDMPTACGSNFLLSVTNTTSADVKNNGAAYGVVSIDLGAPGTNIYSTEPNDSYGSSTGTSMATPHVAGAIALMYSAMCKDNLDDFGTNHAALALHMKDKLLSEGVDELLSLQGLVATGGRLNLHKAVLAAVDSCTSLVLNETNSDCGVCNGQATVAMIGGVSPYQYAWSNGDTGNVSTNLCPGVYGVTASDASGNVAVGSAVISDADGPAIDVSKVELTCYGGNDGQVQLSGADVYHWQDGSSLSSRAGLAAGEYTVLAIDTVTNCTTIVNFVLEQPDQIQLSFQSTDPSPNSASNGTITVSANGGQSPYSYNWGAQGSANQLFGLESGWYMVTVTDASGCSVSDSIWLGDPLGIEGYTMNSVKIYPNPASKTLLIGGLAQKAATWSLIDLTGCVVISGMADGELTHVNLSGIPNGQYVMRIVQQNEVLHRKVQIVQ